MGMTVNANDEQNDINVAINNALDLRFDDLFVGGSKFDISDLTNGQYSEGFNGCISSLSFQKFKLPGQSGPQKIGMVGIGFNDVQVFSTDSLHNIQCVSKQDQC